MVLAPALEMSQWITTAEYAKLKGMSAEYVRRLAREHKIPAVKLGQNYLVYIGDMESQETK